ncbi:MAG TPA: membrane protein insertion efficiency factor YidD [Coxiellaceae bacterium]|nr:MAG: membrane protein insertion efficiency factor YidD [Gammaproteobacteria bacterium RIFCSPHIGHO2_12_FULL_36_30]HLB55920.1 membrane protein insertion efficiency factor YidD [Coxiellaceae bacterium]
MYKKIIYTINCALRWICIKMIRVYQKCISPFLGNHCRFYPSCSQYAHDAFSSQPFFKAIYLTVKRILRCNPFCKGGMDYVDHTHITR